MFNKVLFVLDIKIVLGAMTRFLSDDAFCKMVFFLKNRRLLNLAEPRTFSEKLYWLKLRTDMASLSRYADKVAVRHYVQEKIGADVLVPVIGIYATAEQFNLAAMPERFVLKLNSASGFNLIVTDKTRYSEAQIRRLISKWLQVDFYRITRERQYQPITNKVIAEHFLDVEQGKALLDYKVYCFNGQPEMIQVISERSGFAQSHTYYDVQWDLLDIYRKEYGAGQALAKPEKLAELLAYAAALAQDFSFSRIDFYIIKQKIYFGEITFIPANANLQFLPAAKDLALARKISISE
ncbi:hypothetical protein WG68_02375 [Arsukibacterium ikkense]|uniref:Uncharacterized protein n=1 Tax=Arsukibacterium ikkense TaxID=336831 RepID=A0A0M2V7J0_9GAMM|nr:ATP-grasp fold amidoligase family protein [Arsukibacterium ikkense]KKO46812.1 hypothetical protein WG68_02375 [Arsukibacterium ikkense]